MLFNILLAIVISSISLVILIQTKNLSKKYNFFDNPASEAKKIHKYSISNIGGASCLIPFLISIIISFYLEDFFSKKYLIVIFISSFLYFFLGRYDDIKNISPSVKFVSFVFIFLFFYPFETDLIIKELRFNYLNLIISLNDYSIFFTLFCMFVFYNASNFIDGANGLSSGYFLLINSFIYLLITKLPNVSENIINLNIIIIKVYFIFFLFNIFGKCFFGDNGIYVSLIINSYLLINLFVLNYNYFSPYFIASLLWYPAFENLFTILRRLKDKKKLISPDNQHLHYLLMMKLKNINFFEKKGKKFFNSLSGLIINLILFPGFVFSLHFYNNSLYLLLNICAYLIIYILSYIFLYKKNFIVNENLNI